MHMKVFEKSHFEQHIVITLVPALEIVFYKNIGFYMAGSEYLYFCHTVSYKSVSQKHTFHNSMKISQKLP